MKSHHAMGSPRDRSKAQYISLTVPGAEGLGVAGRTALYPSLALGTTGIRPLLGTSVDESLLRECRQQVLIITEGPDKRHRDALEAADRVGCPTLLVPWSNAALVELYKLADGINPLFVRFADPRDAALSADNQRVIPNPLLAPARPGLDQLLLAKFPILRTSAWTCDRAETPALPPVVIFASTSADIMRVADKLPAAGLSWSNLPLIIITPNLEETSRAAQRFLSTDRVIDERDPKWLDDLRRSHVALVPNAAAETSESFLHAAIWALTALRAGVPVIADANPLLDPVAGAFICDDWERGLKLYSGGSNCLRATDAALGQAKAARAEWWRWALPCNECHPWLRGGVPLRAPRECEKPVLLAFLDLAQDLDVLLPVLQALRRRSKFRLRICVTDWLKNEAPRTFAILDGEGFSIEVVSRKHSIEPPTPSLENVHAVLSASETNQRPHRFAHALARRAAAAEIPTFTLQHGFENIGLTYQDVKFGAEVGFASSRVFVWFPQDLLPAWVSPDTFSKVVSTGRPKTESPPSAFRPLAELGSWSQKIGVFENLHWHRFSENYKHNLFFDLERAAEEFSETLFIVKPHSAGRWLLRNRSLLPRCKNVLLIDPLQPEWQLFTAPALMRNLDAVITTPSTVAVDAARAGCPVAVIGYDLDLSIYQPLPILVSSEDWRTFLERVSDSKAHIIDREAFLRRNFVPYAGQYIMADAIDAAVNARSRLRVRE